MNSHEITIETPGGEIHLETGRVARHADGAVVLRHRDTVILATAVAASEPRPGVGFFPLTVEYREKLSAAGRIPGSYFRREGRITDAEVLVSRLVDRTIRPLFPKGFACETQVLLTVLSADEQVEPSGLAIVAAAAALEVSDIPFSGPAAGVRIARGAGKWKVFPSRRDRLGAEVDLVVSASGKGLVMVEGEARQATEERVVAALERGAEVCRSLAGGIGELGRRVGRSRREWTPPEVDEELAAQVASRAAEPIDQALGKGSKAERRTLLEQIRRDVLAAHAEREEEAAALFEAEVARRLRAAIVSEGRRPDGRGPEEIRAITGEVGWLPRPHGSAIFTRGETQALVTCTLGTVGDEQRYETLEGSASQRFLLHYNFPPYSVGEVRPQRGPGRREIGHGDLAHRALSPVLPEADDFAYTIRLVSDISESNGSSSMATVCGGCLALMDAGVPIRAPVAGIAMGLIHQAGEYVVLSDILGEEDHLGDMDFKVAGTREGITAIQMDNKLGALPEEVLSRALEQARRGREHILGEMEKILDRPRDDLAASAPRVQTLRIRPERIGAVIGPGGKTIQEIQANASCRIDIQDDGLVRIYSEDAIGARKARARIEALTLEPEVGKVYDGKVIVVRDFFAVVQIAPGVEGRLHVSELENRRVGKVSDVLSVGDETPVRVQGVDRQGRIVLSRRAALAAG
ncbi:MAG: polyribonucleotide nucleotidyltransferase [Acidobacteriota bacterium]|nr:polyribonucleotide nucleotidyltransferase [Acidobacteriota bacterium]